MKITAEHVVSISGLNMVRQIILKHLEFMCVCRSHSFEVFVSLSNLIKFYTYVIANAFMTKATYDLLMNDVIMYGTFQPLQN